MINLLINDRMLDVGSGYLTNSGWDVASIHRHHTQVVDRPTLVALVNCLAEYPLQMYKFLIKILSSSLRPSLIIVMLNSNQLTGYRFTGLETGSQSEKPVYNRKIFIIVLWIYKLIILLLLMDRKINNHAPWQPFPRYSNVTYMLPATQLQKDALW